MKIALMAYSSLPVLGGAQVFSWNLVQGLMARGHEVHYYLPRKHCRRIRTCCIGKTDVRPIFMQEFPLSRVCPKLITGILGKHQARERYDVWQVVGAYPAGSVAYPLAETVPVVLRCHGEDIQKDPVLCYGSRLKPALDRIITRAVQGMTKVVALTASVSDCYRELGLPDERIVEIPNGVDVSRFQKPKVGRAFRLEWGVPDDVSMILTTGRYHIKKGYEIIPACARRLLDRGYRFKWYVVGRGVSTLAARIQEAGLEASVILKEHVEDAGTSSTGALQVPSDALVDLYRAADLYAMPSLLETFGMVLIEAMAAGLPVVTTDAPGCRDVVVHDENGLQARRGSPEDLADKIERVLGDEATREALVQGGLSAAERFEWDHVVGAYETLYKELAG